jgi:hypothetical protein
LKKRFTPEVWQNVSARYTDAWKIIDPGATVSSEGTIEEALDKARDIGNGDCGMCTLVIGSLHLVSGVLCLLEPGEIKHRLFYVKSRPLARDR